jgi:molecular chaperone IbpA
MQASDPLDPRAVLGAAKAQPGNAGASRKPSATAGLDLPCARRDRRSAGRDLVDAVQHGGTEDNYPPCNVERLSEDRYQISLAVAGFSPDEIAITAEQSVLTVEGRKAEKHQREFLYQGVSSRPFKRQFSLADYVQVKGAAFDNGLLQIELVREIPEAMKPRRISIEGSPASNIRQIDGKSAA